MSEDVNKDIKKAIQDAKGDGNSGHSIISPSIAVGLNLLNAVVAFQLSCRTMNTRHNRQNL